MVKAENNTLRDEIIKQSHKVDQVDKVKIQVEDTIGSLEETLKRDLRPEIEDISKIVNEMQEKFTQDSRQKENNIKTLMTALDEEQELFNKFKKDTQKKFTK